MESKDEKKFKVLMKKTAKLISVLILMLIVIGIIVGGYVYVKVKPTYDAMSIEAKEVVSNINKNTFKRLDPTVITRKDGSVVREYKHAPYKYISIEETPVDVKKSFVSIEDKRFYDHPGIDLKANVRATIALIKNKGEITQGASTITQQLVKNIFLTNEQSFERKFKEIVLSLEIEKEISKDKILEYYINNIYFGNGVYGIATASEYYFSKPLDELSLSEIAFIASIPNNPTIYDPIENKDNTISRRNLILQNMLEDEIINETQFVKEKGFDVELNIKPKEKYTPENYEETFIMSSAVRLIMESEGFELKYKFESDQERKEYNEQFADKFSEVDEKLRAGGYEIISTIDPDKQQELQSSINNGLSRHTFIDPEKGIYRTQAAGATINNLTNELVAIVGGRTQQDKHNTFNRAFLAYRQPASAIKPIISYGPEIDEGLLAGDTLVDKKYTKGPRNHNGRYLGEVSVREALVRSINTIPFELMRKRGAESAKDYMTSMEFNRIVDGDSNAGISIGGFTYGTSPLELTSAFATLANDGNYIRPTGIDAIIYNNEATIYKNNKDSKAIYKDGTAYLLTDMLKDVMTEKYGTGYKRQIGDMPVAGKTGTSSDNKDGWFAGYTPYYTTAIWVGNDDSTPIKGLYGSSEPGLIWQDYMKKIHQGLKIRDFKIPNGTKKMYLNPKNRYVSEVKKRGYTRYEIIPAHYIFTMEEAEAKAIEKARIEKEMREREARLERERLAKIEAERKLAFKEKYGVEEDIELANQSVVRQGVNTALQTTINSEEDYLYALNLISNAQENLANVIVPEDKDQLQLEINNSYNIIEQRRQDMIIRVEEERKAREREEIERLEREKELLEKELLEKEQREKEEAEREKENQEQEDNQLENENGNQENQDD